jgi:ATP-dependent protease ClpP protease subunit
MFKKKQVNKILLGFIAPLAATLFVACSSSPTVPTSKVTMSEPKSSMGNKEALWQEFQAEKARKEMNKKLEEEKQKGN